MLETDHLQEGQTIYSEQDSFCLIPAVLLEKYVGYVDQERHRDLVFTQGLVWLILTVCNPLQISSLSWR